MDWMAVAIGVTSALALSTACFLAGLAWGRGTSYEDAIGSALDSDSLSLSQGDLEAIKQAVWFDVALRSGDGPSHTPAYFLTRP